MKAVFAVAASAGLAIGAGAQNMYDAINFSRNEYTGSARSLGMGNAVTAVGGDLGMIGINPAGSAVALCNLFTISPGVSVSAVSSAYSPYGESAYGTYNSTNRTRMTMPNIGLSMVFETGRRTGLKSWTIALVSNQTAQYNYSTSAMGYNSQTSKVAEFAVAASGLDESVLSNGSSFYGSNVSWDILTAYQARMFGTYGQGNNYVGVTEAIADDASYCYVPGELAQNSVVESHGSKNDLILNLGLNFSDKFYAGLNIGFPIADYSYSESFYESAVNPEQFLLSYDDGGETYFNSASYAYRYVADIRGVYAKLGFIYKPLAGLRLGAAIMTPTAYTITEYWQYSASTSYSDSYYNESQTSPEGEYSYHLVSPYSFNLGAAYTFSRGMLSVDYEFTDYSVMRFRETSYSTEDIFMDLNMANKNFAGAAHELRVGGEFFLTPSFAIRAGYNISSSPEKYWTDSSGDTVTASSYLSDFDTYYSGNKSLITAHRYGDATTSYSFGIGYSSKGAFFADLGAKLTRYPVSVFAPYYDYENYNSAGELVNTLSPRVQNKINLWNIVLTVGWAF